MVLDSIMLTVSSSYDSDVSTFFAVMILSLILISPFCLLLIALVKIRHHKESKNNVIYNARNEIIDKTKLKYTNSYPPSQREIVANKNTMIDRKKKDKNIYQPQNSNMQDNPMPNVLDVYEHIPHPL